MKRIGLARVLLAFALSFLAQFRIAYSQISTTTPQKLDEPFVAVFVDDATEKTLGPFPYDRAKYAQVIAALREAKAKGVVVKFFLDQPKTAMGDDQLAAVIKTIPVLLQARLNSAEKQPNVFPSRLDSASIVRGETGKIMSGQSGWVPLEKFSSNCVGIGFVDVASENDVLDVPMVLKYKGMVVPSLDLSILELTVGKPAQIQIGQKMTIEGHSLPCDQMSRIHTCLPAKDQMDAISFIDVLNGNFDKEKVEGKVVVLGFDAKETPTLPTSLGTLGIHRIFYYALESLYQQLKAH